MKWWIMDILKQQNPKSFNSMLFSIVITCFFFIICGDFLHWRVKDHIINAFRLGTLHKRDSSWLERVSHPLYLPVSLVQCPGGLRVSSTARTKCFWMLWRASIWWYIFYIIYTIHPITCQLFNFHVQSHVYFYTTNHWHWVIGFRKWHCIAFWNCWCC